jgi:mono/diheme cytochrome c family protein
MHHSRLILLTLLATACSTRRPPPPGASGDVIYALQNCANCHGETREGTRLGPALLPLSPSWTRERLAEYLADPRALVASDERLAALDRQFSTDMGPYANLSQDERLVLAGWLLAP